MRNVASSVAALGALSLAYACTSSIEVGYDGPGGGGAGTTAASTSTGRGATTSTGATGEGGAGTTATSSASTTGGGAGTTTTSTASTGAGGGEVGPCTPAPLVGINWNGTDWQTARLDPLTGDLTLLAVLSAGSGGFEQGFSAYDPATRHLYEFGNSGVYTIDGTTGAVLGFVAIDANNIYNPKVNAAGQIIVIHLLPGGTDETARLDPTTGALTSLAPVPYTTYGQAECAVDSKANRIYQFGPGFVLTIDGATGATLANTTPTPEFDNAIVNYAGELIGIDYPSSVIGRLDPTTGAVTPLAPFSAGTGQGIRAYDPCSNRIYQFGGYTLYTLDGTTGALISTVTMAQQNFLNVEAIW